MKSKTKIAMAEETNKPMKKSNAQNLIVRSGEEARQLGRKGGIASGAARRARCSFADSLRQALTVPIPMTSDRHRDWVTLLERFGMCDLNAQNLIVCRMIQSAIGGDVKAAAFIRDTLMLTDGGIEDTGDTKRPAPVTADGIDRLTRYHFLEVAEVRDRFKGEIESAELRDRLGIGIRQAETERETIAATARMYQGEGLIALDEDANGVRVNLNGIERLDDELAHDAEEVDQPTEAEDGGGDE